MYMDTFCCSEKTIHGNKLGNHAKPFQNPKQYRHETLSLKKFNLSKMYCLDSLAQSKVFKKGIMFSRMC
jgi:hypothetical protein